MVFMTTLSSWRAEYKRTHPSSSTNAPEEPDVPDKSGSGIPPWRDKSIQDKIPDVFTIDVDSAVSAESLELAAVVCTCEWCQNWMTTMRWTYCDPIFCITSTTNRGDFEFYKSIGVTRWPSDARYYPGFGTVCVSSDGILCMKSEGRLLQGKTCYEEDEEESVEREGPWFMVVCIGRRGQLGTYSPDNPRAAHILLPHDIIPRGQVIGDFYLFPNGFTIQAFSSDDPSAAHFPSITGGVVMDPDSPENWELARSYLASCRRNHARCRRRDAESERAGFRPTHLVDILIERDDTIRLIEGRNLAQKDPADTDYLTLSYCWGENTLQPYRTIKANVAERLSEGFPLGSQPASIQDAIKVTKTLGYRYLWVDSLCIIQDDKFDMMREILHMDKIYQHSTLLVSAARAQKSCDGFLGRLEETFVDQEVMFAVPFRYRSRDVPHRHVVLQAWEHSKAEQPIHTRAWTLQEHVLSRRILAFGGSGMRWSCFEAFKCGFRFWSMFQDQAECLNDDSTMSMRAPRSFSDETVDDFDFADVDFESADQEEITRQVTMSMFESKSYEEWSKLRTNFFRRRLMRAEDRLLAFSAVAKQFKAAFGTASDPQYLAGHWACHILYELPQSRGIKDRPQPFPTWSWANCNIEGLEDYPVLDPGDTYKCMKPSAKLISTHMDLVNPDDPFGEVHPGRLCLAARVITTPWRLEQSSDTEVTVQDKGRLYFCLPSGYPKDVLKWYWDTDFLSMSIPDFEREFRYDDGEEFSGPEFCLLELLEPNGGGEDSRTELSTGLLIRRRRGQQHGGQYIRAGAYSMQAAENRALEHPWQSPFLGVELTVIDLY